MTGVAFAVVTDKLLPEHKINKQLNKILVQRILKYTDQVY